MEKQEPSNKSSETSDRNFEEMRKFSEKLWDKGRTQSHVA